MSHENFKVPQAVIIRCRNQDCEYEHIWHKPENIVNLPCPDCGAKTYQTPTRDICHLPYGRANGPNIPKRRIDKLKEWEEPECQ